MEAKSSSQMRFFWSFFSPAVCRMLLHKIMFVHVSEHDVFFSLNCGKFDVECDWNSKNSQNVQKMFFFGKIDVFFS